MNATATALVAPPEEPSTIPVPVPVLSSSLSASTSTSTAQLFIVQKCWFDGPRIQPSLDLPILFSQRSHAEAVAARSAHAYSRGEPVRTILLDHDGYAFATTGQLFWVRNVEGMVADTTKSPSNLRAFCVLNRFVVGGTGNPNSRRGSERRQGCVVIANGEASAHSLLGEISPGSKVQVLPISEGAGVLSQYDSILQFWPDACDWLVFSIDALDRKRGAVAGDNQQYMIGCELKTLTMADMETSSRKRRVL
jgi:hypothetical protein